MNEETKSQENVQELNEGATIEIVEESTTPVLENTVEDAIASPEVEDLSLPNEEPEEEAIPDHLEVEEEENGAPQEEVLPAPDPVAWDSLTSEAIISTAKQWITDYEVSQLKELDSVPPIFDATLRQEEEAARNAFIEAGNDASQFTFESDAKERFNAIYKIYRDKRNEQLRRSETEKEENLKIKQQIIEEIKNLVQNEDSLNKSFTEFRKLQDRWRETGMVPQSSYKDLIATYQLHVDNFYKYTRINRELRDLDLRKNLDKKIAYCEEAEKLSEETNIETAFKALQELHQRWREVGQVPRDQKEAIWERFRAATAVLNDRYHQYLDQTRGEMEEHLAVKNQLCEKAEAIANGEYTQISAWNEATKAILDLQQQWKESGEVQVRDRSRVYKHFRKHCDKFFDRKRDFYQQNQEEQRGNLELKTALCEQVEALKDSTDWKETTDKIIALQAEWKKIGPVSQKVSNKIWTRFRSACDTFFNNKATALKGENGDQKNNLVLKKALLEEIRSYVFTDSSEDNIAALRTFQARWAEIGFVPFREKEKLQNDFRDLMNDYFNRLEIPEFERHIERFKSKVSTFDANKGKDYKIVGEREKLMVKIKQTENDIHIWENNIGFFANSKNAESMINDVKEKIAAARERLVLMYEKLKVIDNMI